jgi:hypothetical protein
MGLCAGLQWDLWVAADGVPVVLKALSHLTGAGGKATVMDTYRNWKFDFTPDRRIFTFSPDAETKKVRAFNRN